MLIEKEQADSLCLLASMEADNQDARARHRAVSAAKVAVRHAVRFISEAGVQMHGGMGVTEENILSQYVKRLSMVQATFGDCDHHLAHFGAVMASETEEA